MTGSALRLVPDAAPQRYGAMVTLMLVSSLIGQLGAVALTVRLVAITERRLGWILVSAAFACLAVRRGWVLHLHLINPANTGSVTAEVFAVAFTFLSFAGLIFLTPYVRKGQSSERVIHQLEEQFRQSQKMEALGRMAGGVAHDFNNMLTVIMGYAEEVRNSLPPSDPRQANLQEVLGAASRAADLSRRLLAFSRRQPVRPVVLDINQVVRRTETMLKRLVGEDVRIESRLSDETPFVVADRNGIEQVLMNLAVNARDAMPKGGSLAIETSRVSLSDKDSATRAGLQPGVYAGLSLRDTGVGMSEEVRHRVFEPFFTTKESGKGTGLGLSIVYGIVKQAGGHIGVASSEGRGTRFDIYLPVAPEGTKPEFSPTPGRSLGQGALTVLVVDDEGTIREMVRAALARGGHTVLVAGDGVEALETSRKQGGRIDLVVSDSSMPRSGGHELAQALEKERPGTRFLLMSGFSGEEGGNVSGYPYLAKPFTVEELMAKVRQVVEGGGS